MALVDEPERLVELGLRVAQVYEVQLEDVDSAVARYRRVLTADPENQNAVRALDRLFTQAERWADLAEVLEKDMLRMGPSRLRGIKPRTRLRH